MYSSHQFALAILYFYVTGLYRVKQCRERGLVFKCVLEVARSDFCLSKLENSKSEFNIVSSITRDKVSKHFYLNCQCAAHAYLTTQANQRNSPSSWSLS